MKLVALALFLLGLIVFVFFFSFYRDVSNWALPAWRPFIVPKPSGNSTAQPGFDYWIYPGDQNLHFYHKIKNETSLEGMRSVENLKIDVIVFGPTGTLGNPSPPAPFRVYENIPASLLKPNDRWSEKVKLKKDDAQDSINVDVKIEAMPKDEDLWGRDARLVVSGKLTFPQKASDKEYVEKTLPLREETPFRFAARAEKEKYEAANQKYQQEKVKADAYNARTATISRVVQTIGFLASALLVIGGVLIFIRSGRRKRI